MLTNWHMRPTVVEDAASALRALQEAREKGQTFQLILIDANMPEMDGYALAEEIKKHPELGNSFIMMLSSAGFRGEAARCRKLGLSAYLTKPIKQSYLLDAIMLALGTGVHKPGAGGQAPFITRHSLSKARQQFNILLAEDNVINQKLAVRILERREHKVKVANNGAEAMEWLEKETFRPDPDGRPDAEDGRVPGHGRNPGEGDRNRESPADRGHDRPRHERRPGEMPRIRHG